MIYFTKVLTLLGLTINLGFSQFSKIQFVNNTPEQIIDIYLNGTKYVNDLKFRAGTSYLVVPAGDVVLQIALENSESAEDALSRFSLILNPLESYIGMVGGESSLDHSKMDFFLSGSVSEYASTASTVDIILTNGILSPSSLDLVLQEIPIFEEIGYGTFSPAISLPPMEYELVVSAAIQENEVVISRYSLDISPWVGRSLFIFTSGYTDGRLPNIETCVLLFDGTIFTLENTLGDSADKYARVQIIHNAPTENLDIYLNTELLYDDLVFRQSKTHPTFTAEKEILLGFTNQKSNGVAEVQQVVPLTFKPESTNLLFVNGKVTDTVEIELVTKDLVQLEAKDNQHVAIAFGNMAENMPIVDVYINGWLVFDDILPYTCSEYVNLPTSSWFIDITDAADKTKVYFSYLSHFNFWRGKSAVLFTSGNFFEPASNFQTRAVLSNNSSFPLSPITRR